MRTLSGTIVTQFGPNRARYERFDLVLPQKSKVSRTPDGAIEIDTPKFLLHIEAVFDGFGAVLPSRFERLYLRQDDHSNLLPYHVAVNFAVTFKPLSLFTQSGWDYHRWLDSFLDSFERQFSRAHFLRRISWESARTVIELMEGARKLEPVKHSSAATSAKQ